MPKFEIDPAWAPGACVYIFKVDEDGPYKIGRTSNVAERLHNWQNIIPFLELNIVAVHFTVSAKRLERALHEHYREHRISNTEWFDLSDDVVNTLFWGTDELLDFFGIYESSLEDNFIEEDEELDDPTILRDIIKKPQVKPRRLNRLPDDQEVSPEKIPTIQDEFEHGLLPEMAELHENLNSWKAVGDHYGVSKEITYNVAMNRIMPFDNKIRRKFGLCTIRQLDIEAPLPEGIE